MSPSSSPPSCLISVARRAAAILTHSHLAETAAAVQLACKTARRLGVEIVLTPDEAVKHHVVEGDGLRVQQDATTCCDVLIAFGGDGTTLRALHAACPDSPPVFAINFGGVGYLRTAGRDGLVQALTAALVGDFETMEVPALAYRARGAEGRGFNDVVVRSPGHSIASLSVEIDGQPFGVVRGDGVIAATPVGSTGHNLAAGGPAVAWGVDGYVLSFLAPHTVAHRPVVAAPEHEVKICNAGATPVDVIVDGRSTAQLAGRSALTVRYERSSGRLARLADGGFFGRYSENFGCPR